MNKSVTKLQPKMGSSLSLKFEKDDLDNSDTFKLDSRAEL